MGWGMCADPFTIAGMAIGAIGSVVGMVQQSQAQNQAAEAQQRQAIAQQQQLLMQQNIANQNAAIQDRAAQDALRQGSEDEKTMDLQAEAVIGEQRSLLAARGYDVDEGTPLQLMLDVTRAAEIDKGNIRWNAKQKSYAYQVEAWNYRSQGSLYGTAAANIDTSKPSTGSGIGGLFDGVSQLGKLANPFGSSGGLTSANTSQPGMYGMLGGGV